MRSILKPETALLPVQAQLFQQVLQMLQAHQPGQILQVSCTLPMIPSGITEEMFCVICVLT